SVRQTPQADTWTRTWWGPGRGVGTSTRRSGARGRSRTAARMLALYDRRAPAPARKFGARGRGIHLSLGSCSRRQERGVDPQHPHREGPAERVLGADGDRQVIGEGADVEAARRALPAAEEVPERRRGDRLGERRRRRAAAEGDADGVEDREGGLLADL